jgi:hypothetical protein
VPALPKKAFAAIGGVGKSAKVVLVFREAPRAERDAEEYIAGPRTPH